MIGTKKIKGFLTNYAFISYGMLFFFVMLTLGVNYSLYVRIQEMFKTQLQNRIESIASTASVAFTAEELSEIQGASSAGTEIYINTVKTLQSIREKNDRLYYIYLLRKTDDPQNLEFVADADSLDPFAEVDLNEDGVIDESDALVAPGDPYEIAEDDLIKHGFLVPVVDDELVIDQWGTFLSAFAPIQSADGQSNELIGIDVEVSDYVTIINAALVPFGLFLLLLLVILSSQTIVLVRMWGSRVDLLRELDRQKDELLSIVSHQLAQPISALKWYIEMLVDGDVGTLTKEQMEYLKTMNASAANLADLSSMILDVSRFQLGKPKLDRVPVDLNDFFKEILSGIEPKAEEKKMDFKKVITKDLPKEVMLDKRLTRMTIENLLTNAVKYTPEKGAVSFIVENRSGTLYVEVKDSGVGIPEADQKKIFGKQYRASNTNGIDGNGFGLFVAKNAIEAQGGKIWFESTQGKGTTFFVEMPLVTPAEEAKKEGKKS